jgi:GTP-binding protein LepA
VFCGLYPTDANHYNTLKDALDKLRLNDSSFTFEPETSAALGFGFRGGFLGMLHMEIIKERLEREFGVELVNTAPTTLYRITIEDGTVQYFDNPSKLPSRYRKIEEPFVKVTIFLPQRYIGQIIELCQERRGIQTQFMYLSGDRVMLIYEIPLSEILLDFYDKLKSLTSGYASMDYEMIGYRESDIVRLNVLINGDMVDALSLVVHKEQAYAMGRQLVERLKQVIPRQLYEVVVQAAIGSRIISRESIKPLRKNVTARCYGGDVTRKRKLLEKQRQGKRRLKQVGRVSIPQEAFMSVIKVK